MTTFFISDTHFSHSNVLTFTREDGTPLRDFSSIEDMNEHIIKQWNSVVRPDDLVYHLGDVVMNERYLPIVHRLMGRKILLRGNHDYAPTLTYLEYFEEVYATYNFKSMILSHFPLEKNSIIQRYKVNVHGHLHANIIKDPTYVNVCVECLDYTPISLEDLRKKCNL